MRSFIAEIGRAAKEVTEAGQDVGQLMTTFRVTLQSVKKLTKADAVVGVDAAAAAAPIAIVRRSDPNDTHPLTRKKVIAALGKLHGRYSTPYILQVLSWKHDLASDERYCWTTANGLVRQYSAEVISFIKRLSPADIDAALKDYQQRPRSA